MQDIHIYILNLQKKPKKKHLHIYIKKIKSYILTTIHVIHIYNIKFSIFKKNNNNNFYKKFTKKYFLIKL